MTPRDIAQVAHAALFAFRKIAQMPIAEWDELSSGQQQAAVQSVLTVLNSPFSPDEEHAMQRKKLERNELAIQDYVMTDRLFCSIVGCFRKADTCEDGFIA